MGAGVTVRVVVGDDSSIFREVAREVLEGDGDIAVVGEAVDGPDTIAAVRRHRPDLLLVDLQMPGMSGLSAIEQVMAGSPVPIVLITARRGDDTLAFEAMRRGALEVLDKGVVAQRPAWLREQVRQLARVPVVRRPAARPAQATAVVARAAPARVAGEARVRVVGIGASAGGPPAVAAVLAALGRATPLAIGVVQHLTAGFASSYVRFLADSCRLPVRLVRAAAPFEPGVVCVAPDEQHLVATATGWALRSDGAWPFRPSIDALFLSLAEHHGRAAAGVVLSGMGNDGARGLAALSQAGGLALVQDEASAAVFGMPREAAASAPGARVLPLSALGGELARAAHD